MILDLEKLNTIHCLQQKKSMNKFQILNEIQKRKIELRASGLQKNGTAILLNCNNLQFFIDLFAVWEMEGRCLVINETTNNNILDRILSYYQINLIIGKGGNLIGTLLEQAKSSLSAPLMLVSSGTSGQPKIVELSESRIIGRIRNIQEMVGSQVNTGLLFLSTSFGHG